MVTPNPTSRAFNIFDSLGCLTALILFILLVATIIKNCADSLVARARQQSQIEQLLEKEFGKGNYNVNMQGHGFYIARDQSGAVKVITYWDNDPRQRA